MSVPWFSAFLSAFSVGLLAFGLPVPAADTGRGFHRMLAGGSLAFAAFAVLTRPLAATAPAVTACVWLGACAFASALAGSRAGRVSAAFALIPGCVALAAAVRFESWIAGASLFASAAMLGTVFDTMVLGHWYLVKRGMPFSHFRRMNLLFAAAIGARALALGAEALFVTQVYRGSLEDRLVFTLRVAVGVAGPAALAWMAGRCIRLRSNQSATGLLYVACVFVLIGEMASTWSLRNL